MTYWLKKTTVLLPKDLNHHLYFKIMILSHTIDYHIYNELSANLIIEIKFSASFVPIFDSA
jgi:hypothetical protein